MDKQNNLFSGTAGVAVISQETIKKRVCNKLGYGEIIYMEKLL